MSLTLPIGAASNRRFAGGTAKLPSLYLYLHLAEFHIRRKCKLQPLRRAVKVCTAMQAPRTWRALFSACLCSFMHVSVLQAVVLPRRKHRFQQRYRGPTAFNDWEQGTAFTAHHACCLGAWMPMSSPQVVVWTPIIP